jgi:hypothetical protein
MSSDPEVISSEEPAEFVELPRPTVAPMVLALGLTMLAAGVATNPAFLVVGAAIFLTGLGLWIAELAPRGEHRESFVEPSRRPHAIAGKVGGVRHMHEGMPGSRLRLPVEVHPISAGIKGGLLGGLLMPAPALLWGLLSGHGIWYPANLLTGLVLPGVDQMTVGELEQFRPTLLLLGLAIHAINSVTFGLMYGVLTPTLPDLPRPLAWGGLAMPMLWTALTFGLMGLVNPLLSKDVDWPSFIAAQFLFGVVAASTITLFKNLGPLRAGLLGGVAGGLAMPIAAIVWGLSSGRGIWYPANLLAAMVLPDMDKLPPAELSMFHPGWLAIALPMHAAMSLGFGAIFGVLMPRFRPIPSNLAWGGLLMPLLWTSVCFGLMGVVNPLLQERVSWPWFVVAQFVFGLVTAIVVERSERLYIPPAGRGPNEPRELDAGAARGES